MVDHEGMHGGELEATAGRFISYVEAHSAESDSGVIGDVRGGEYALYNPADLVPVDLIKFVVFSSAEPDEEQNEANTGHVIYLMQGDVERYSIDYVNGKFTEGDGGMTAGLPTEPVVATNFLDKLQRIEAEGRLLPKA